MNNSPNPQSIRSLTESHPVVRFTKKTTMRAFLAAACLSALSWQKASAVLIAYDNFSSITNSGSGFSNNWNNGGNTNANFVLNPVTLTYPDLATSGQAALNNTAATGGTAVSTFRTLSSSQTTGTVYISFLFSSTTSANTFTDFSIFRSGLEVVSSGIAWTGSQASTTIGTYVKSSNTFVSSGLAKDTATHLMVLQLNLDTNVGSAYIDPTLSLGVLPTANYSFTSANLDFDQVRIEANHGTVLDEIRLGTTLADILPVPEPQSAALVAGGLVLIFGVRRTRKAA